jgi:hypothetical protein
MAAIGDRYRTVLPISVVVRWELDTVAILDDYSESLNAELPAGETLDVVEIADAPHNSTLCNLDRERELIDLFVPRDRQNRFLGLRLPTPYRVEIKLDDLVTRCAQLKR